MNKSVVISARVRAELSDQIDELARDYDRSRAWIVSQAIERYVTEEAKLLDAIKKGQDDLDAGRTFTQEEVETMFSVKRNRRDAA